MNTYAKGEGKLDLRAHNQSQHKNSSKSQQGPIKSVPGYSKIDGTLSPALFIIVSGGEKRERDYFRFFIDKNQQFPRITLEYFDKDEYKKGGLDVDKLVQLAIKIKNEKQLSKDSDISDSISIITDVDHFYSQIVRNIPICKTENLNLVISNPCFEIWLYYGHYETLPTGFCLPEDPLKISSSFKRYLNEKHPGGVDSRKAPPKLSDAIKNSKSNYQFDKNSIPKLFSTQMYILGEKLWNLTKDTILE